MISSKKLKIGVCGYGSIGSRHVRLLSNSGDVEVFVADPVEEHLREAKKVSSVSAAVRSVKEIMEMGLDGLIIAPDEFVFRRLAGVSPEFRFLLRNRLPKIWQMHDA